MELERIGLRQESLPFDWLITEDLDSVLWLISNNFEGFLEKDDLYQEKTPDYYFNKRFSIHFYHDFVSTKSLVEQYDAVIEKYRRRIKRFYEIISYPTVFIRSCVGGETEYILKHQEEIESLLKSFNKDNRIIYISAGNAASLSNLYCVEGKNRKHFLEALPELKTFLLDSTDLTCEQIEANLVRYRKRNGGGIRKLKRYVRKYFRIGIYVHPKQYRK